MKTIKLFTGIILFLVIAVACNKNKEKATYHIYLTDAPGEFENVYIDIQEIRIHSNSTGWITATNFNPGIYDLLEFNNGMDTLLCSVEIPQGRVTQIRLVLGNNNSVVIDGETHALSTPSAQSSGLKLNVQHEILAGNAYTIWLDFDAGQSIVTTGNGSYQLKPVIRVFTEHTNGKIQGYVTPMLALPTVYAINGSDTLSAIPNSDGFFMFCGLSGTYNIHVVPSVAPFIPVYVNNVQVEFGLITDVGVILIPQ